MEVNKTKNGHIAILIANIIFGLNIPISKAVLSDYGFDPLLLSFLRMIGAAILFWTVSLILKPERIKPKHIWIIILASIFGVSLNQVSFIVGLKTTSPIDASLIITLTPIITMLISALHLKEPITFKKTIGVLMGLSGAVILILAGQKGLGNTPRSVLGNSLVLTSALSYSIYLVFFKRFVSKYHPVEIMKWMFLIAAITITPLIYTQSDLGELRGMEIGLLLRILYVIVGATFTTYFLIPIGQKLLRPTTLSMYNYLQPIIASAVAVFFAQEIFGGNKITATILVFLGVYIVTRSKSRADIEAEKLREEK